MNIFNEFTTASPFLEKNANKPHIVLEEGAPTPPTVQTTPHDFIVGSVLPGAALEIDLTLNLQPSQTLTLPKLHEKAPRRVALAAVESDKPMTMTLRGRYCGENAGGDSLPGFTGGLTFTNTRLSMESEFRPRPSVTLTNIDLGIKNSSPDTLSGNVTLGDVTVSCNASGCLREDFSLFSELAARKVVLNLSPAMLNLRRYKQSAQEIIQALSDGLWNDDPIPDGDAGAASWAHVGATLLADAGLPGSLEITGDGVLPGAMLCAKMGLAELWQNGAARHELKLSIWGSPAQEHTLAMRVTDLQVCFGAFRPLLAHEEAPGLTLDAQHAPPDANLWDWRPDTGWTGKNLHLAAKLQNARAVVVDPGPPLNRLCQARLHDVTLTYKGDYRSQTNLVRAAPGQLEFAGKGRIFDSQRSRGGQGYILEGLDYSVEAAAKGSIPSVDARQIPTATILESGEVKITATHLVVPAPPAPSGALAGLRIDAAAAIKGFIERSEAALLIRRDLDGGVDVHQTNIMFRADATLSSHDATQARVRLPGSYGELVLDDGARLIVRGGQWLSGVEAHPGRQWTLSATHHLVEAKGQLHSGVHILGENVRVEADEPLALSVRVGSLNEPAMAASAYGGPTWQGVQVALVTQGSWGLQLAPRDALRVTVPHVAAVRCLAATAAGQVHNLRIDGALHNPSVDGSVRHELGTSAAGGADVDLTWDADGFHADLARPDGAVPVQSQVPLPLTPVTYAHAPFIHLVAAPVGDGTLVMLDNFPENSDGVGMKVMQYSSERAEYDLRAELTLSRVARHNPQRFGFGFAGGDNAAAAPRSIDLLVFEPSPEATTVRIFGGAYFQDDRGDVALPFCFSEFGFSVGTTVWYGDDQLIDIDLGTPLGYRFRPSAQRQGTEKLRLLRQGELDQADTLARKMTVTGIAASGAQAGAAPQTVIAAVSDANAHMSVDVVNLCASQRPQLRRTCIEALDAADKTVAIASANGAAWLGVARVGQHANENHERMTMRILDVS